MCVVAIRGIQAARIRCDREVVLGRGRLFVHHLGFLGRGEVVDFAFGVLGQLLHVVLGLVALIFGEQFLFFAGVGVFVGIASDVSDGDPGFFGEFLDSCDELSSSFGRE